MKVPYCVIPFLILDTISRVDAFSLIARQSLAFVSKVGALKASNESSTGRRMGELTAPEQTVFDFMEAIRSSSYNFRVIVVGRGAILESTTKLGPVMKLTQSPSNGANMITFASDDQSFEFHLQLSQVSKMVLVEKENPIKVLRIVRILNSNGEAMCSLILADESEEAAKWYEDLGSKFGKEIQL